jgi:uncharacterized protein YceK
MRLNLVLGATSFITLCIGLGCTSIGMHVSDEEPEVYGGVRADALRIAHPHEMDDSVPGHIEPWAVVTYSIIDLPFSAAFDTLLLPIDLTYQKPMSSQDSGAVQSASPPNKPVQPTPR